MVFSELTSHPVCLSVLEEKVSDQSIFSFAAKDLLLLQLLSLYQTLDLCFVVSRIGWVLLHSSSVKKKKSGTVTSLHIFFCNFAVR